MNLGIKSLVSKLIDVGSKFIPNAEKKQEYELEVLKLIESDSEFREFINSYEGEFKILPKSMQILRASIRPVFTIWVLVLFNCMLFFPSLATKFAKNLALIPDQMWVIFILIIGFWFGGRAVNYAIETSKKWRGK